MTFSTSEVYGPHAKHLSEDNPAVVPTTGKRWCYAASKLAAEQYTLSYAREKNIPYAIIRPFNVYGPYRSGSNAMTAFIEKALNGDEILISGDGSQRRAWCHIVTAADIEAETAMREVIRHNFPDHSIEGEELGEETGSSEYRWILDPIDGTSNFAMGKPIFGTLVALFKGNVPVMGVIHQPILNETFLGVAGRPTLMNGKEIRTSDLDSFSNALMATNPPYMYENENEKRVLWGLHGDARSTEFGGDCYNYAMLAAGHIDIALVSGDDFHDFAAVIPIVEGAGGIITDWEGNPLTPSSSGHIVATAGPRFHEQVLKRIAHHATPPGLAISAFERNSLSLK